MKVLFTESHTAKDHERMCRKNPRVTKRQVVMRSVVAMPPDEHGRARVAEHLCTSYELPEVLEAYVADARKRWQSVEVADEPCAGPGGYDGDTTQLDHLKRGVELDQHLHDIGAKEIDGKPGFGALTKKAAS